MIPLDRYNAVREGAGLIDSSGRGRCVIRGNDRLTFLHALLTNDITALGPGCGCYAALLTPQGRMVTDMRVFELGDATLLDVPAGVKDALLARLDQLIFTEDVQLGDVTPVWGCLSVQGPRAPEALSRAIAGDSEGAAIALQAGLSQYRPFQNARVEFQGDVTVVARVDEFGRPGFLLFTAADCLRALAAALAAAGAVPVDDRVAEVLRIEAGVPSFPADMNDDTIPLEAGIEQRAISFTKGCYPGQEVIVRIRDRGHGRVARRLVGIAVDGEKTVPVPGDTILAADRDVGRVTSAAWSPALGRPIVLGYVQRDFVDPGSQVVIARGDARLPATVTALPFIANDTRNAGL